MHALVLTGGYWLELQLMSSSPSYFWLAYNTVEHAHSVLASLHACLERLPHFHNLQSHSMTLDSNLRLVSAVPVINKS